MGVKITGTFDGCKHRRTHSHRLSIDNKHEICDIDDKIYKVNKEGERVEVKRNYLEEKYMPM